MAQQLIDRRDLSFVLWEQLQCESLLDRVGGYDRKACEMILAEARTVALNEVLPTLAEGDREGIRFDSGTVTVPESFHRARKLLLDGGWNNLRVPVDRGGQGAPQFVAAGAAEYFFAANWPLYAYTALGAETAELIHLFGTDEQKATYCPKLVSGEWGGTMLLTEPDAGSDVGALTTSATRNADGTFSLRGTKIFITNGEHDLTQNIVHAVLARIDGDPPGVGGISIFIVPKFLVKEDGTFGERNGIVCTGVEEKTGIHASATCSMSLGAEGACTGYLLGEERRGLRIMFKLINPARMTIGLQSLAYASASYLLALDYARSRVQGRALENFTDPTAPSVPIIDHPDVRRNLLWMRAHVDGMRSFFYYVLNCATRGELGATEEERELNTDLYELLTPVVKDYLAVTGQAVCGQAVQVHGGAGYTREYRVEQYARDCRITTIYEGTSGMQAMDLLGRKLGRKDGMAFMMFLHQIFDTVETARQTPRLESLAARLERVANRLGRVAVDLKGRAFSPDFRVAFAHALPFLHAMGDVVMGWMLLWRASTAAPRIEGAGKKGAAFYEGQIKTAEFFFSTVLPLTEGKLASIEEASPAAIEMDDAMFGGY